MSLTLKSVLQYTLMLLLAVTLLWLAFRNLTLTAEQSRIDFLWQVWGRSNKWYLWVTAILSLLSHVLRAFRWKMLLASAHYKVRLGTCFLSLMVGYLVNLALPRGGEISRCYNLFKLDNTPVEVSFGTVVAERSVDILCLFLLTSFSVFLEWDKLESVIISWDSIFDKNSFIWIFMISGILLFGLILYLLRNNKKIRKIAVGFKAGLFSVLRLKNLSLFIITSVAIWVLYFAMTYYIMEAFTITSDLGFNAVVALLTVGSIAISIPLPGGIGSYHTLVPSMLVALYSLVQSDAIAVVFIFHAWQTVVIIAFGIISLFVSYTQGKKKKALVVKHK